MLETLEIVDCTFLAFFRTYYIQTVLNFTAVHEKRIKGIYSAS